MPWGEWLDNWWMEQKLLFCQLIERSDIRMSSSKILLISCFMLSCTLTTKATRFTKQINYNKSLIDSKTSNLPLSRLNQYFSKKMNKNTSLMKSKYSMPVFKRRITEYFLKKIKSKKILSRNFIEKKTVLFHSIHTDSL